MFSRLAIVGTSLLALATALPSKHLDERATWPYGPLYTSGRQIMNSVGDTVVYAGVNWPGAADVGIPEGLQYQSVQTIVSKIKSLGMNAIRLTYNIYMIDDIYNNSPNTQIGNALKTALGSTNGSTVLQQIIKNNPSFSATTTRLQVFDAIAAECYKQQILVHLDNHMSRNYWCCSVGDGNAWFNDIYFNATNWKRGLSYMATHGKNWPALVSMALRNELRDPGNNSPVKANYGWQDWYPNMVAGANAINSANSDVLIFYSGLGFDTDMGAITRGENLGNNEVFTKSSFSYANKIVFELHNYENGLSDTNCADYSLYDQGYNAMDTSSSTTAKNIAPVLLTEFGFPQDNSTYQQPYPACVAKYLENLPGGPGGWFQWVISGSYYIREGIQDYEETWGLLSHDWSSWRSQATIDNFVKPFVAASPGHSHLSR